MFEMLVMLHLTEFEFVVFGHMQSKALTILYCTPDKVVETDPESHVNVRMSALISESMIFGGGKKSAEQSQS